MIALLGHLLLYGTALGATAFAWLLFSVGQANRWTSDGPGMLFIMILFAGSTFTALACWWTIVVSFLRGPEAGASE